MLNIRQLSQCDYRIFANTRQEKAIQLFVIHLSEITQLKQNKILCIVISTLNELENRYISPCFELYNLPATMKVFLTNEFATIISDKLSKHKVEPKLIKKALESSFYKL